MTVVVAPTRGSPRHFRSGVYEGTVTHVRTRPRLRRFRYRLAMPLIDLAELDDVLALHWLWSKRRGAPAQYRREDFLGPPQVPLDQAVRDLVEGRTGQRPDGPVAMLAHVRTFGWLFNPIALYYCFDQAGAEVVALVAEVENTPWHERVAYVVGRPGTHRFDKEMHVSPFIGMDVEYVLTYTAPGDSLSVRFELEQQGRRIFAASLGLRRRSMSSSALARVLWRSPFMTLRVSVGIYRQALALAARRAPFFQHPRRIRRPSGPPLVGDRLDRRDESVGVGAGVQVGGEASRSRTAHCSATEQHGNTRRGGLHGRDSFADGTVETCRSRYDPDGAELAGPRRRLADGRCGCVGAELHHIEATPAQQVRSDGDGERVEVAGGSSQHDGATSAPAAPELQTEPPDDLLGDCRRSVLVGDGQLATSPTVAD